MPALNPLVLDTATPPIPEALGWAAAYDGRAGQLINLSQAVPGYPPHGDLLDRIAANVRNPDTTTYGSIFGDTELREAHAAETSRLYGGTVTGGQVAITAGCNQAFFVTMLAIAKAGDSVILPTPWYFNQKMTLDIPGIGTTLLPCQPEAGFIPSAAEAERLIGETTRAIVLVSPNNPTGAAYPPETLAAFADLCRRRGLWLVIDETYRDFIGSAPHRLFSDPAWDDVLISLYSFSKAYCIPGYRLGAITAGERLITELEKVLDNAHICPSRIAQAPTAWAIPALRDWRAANTASIGRSAAAFADIFAGVNGWRIDSIGSYFAFLRHPFEGRSATDVVKALVTTRGVLCLPGSYFGPGMDNHLRVAFANADINQIGTLRERLAGFELQD